MGEGGRGGKLGGMPTPCGCHRLATVERRAVGGAPQLLAPMPTAQPLHHPAGGHKKHQNSTLQAYTACYPRHVSEQLATKSIVNPALTVQPPSPHNAFYYGGCHAGVGRGACRRRG